MHLCGIFLKGREPISKVRVGDMPRMASIGRALLCRLLLGLVHSWLWVCYSSAHVLHMSVKLMRYQTPHVMGTGYHTVMIFVKTT